MVKFRAQFDGRVLIPENPVELPVGRTLDISATPTEATAETEPALVRLAKLAEQFPENPQLPSDGAAEHDHYLYGRPKTE
jgi:hypothetical protein